MDAKKINQLFNDDLAVINMGVEAFGENLKKEQVKVLSMNWKPPAGGNQKLISLLEKLDQ